MASLGVLGMENTIEEVEQISNSENFVSVMHV